MINIKLSAEIKEPVLLLTKLGVDMQSAVKAIVAALATAGKTWVQKRMGASIGTRTGWLRRHVYGRRRSDFHAVIAAPRHIAEPLERGTTINARKKKMLRFVGSDGLWKSKKTVQIPARHFFTRAYEGFEGSPEYEAGIDKGINRVLKRTFGEGWSISR